MIPKHRHQQQDGTDAWLMTYADMITLLLCFFVIFVSVSEPKIDKLSAITDGVKGKFGAVDYATPFTGAVRSLQETVEKHEIYKDVAVEGTSTTLNMELATHRFFKNGSAEISEDMLPVLKEMAAGLKTVDENVFQAITIGSYTDDTPPKSGLYTNNWELSSARAAKLTHYLIGQGLNPAKIKAVGYGDAHPKVPNFDNKGNPIPENRAQNQRVVVRLE